MPHPRSQSSPPIETVAWAVSLLILVGLYASGSRNGWFGIGAFWTFPSAAMPAMPATIAVCMAAAAAVVADRRPSPRWVDSYPLAILASLVAGAVMFAGRSEFVNPDGAMFADKFQRAVPVSGAFITHDEMLEFLLHSRIWAYANRWWGWSVEFSYQVTSCVAGAGFVVAAFRLARRLAPQSPGVLLFGVFGGGYMQLFFGDVENYTLTALVVAVYVLSASRFLRGDAPLWEPSVALATAMACHLLAGFLIPSLCYLGYVSWRRTQDSRPLLRGAWMAVAVLMLTVAVVHYYGAPVWTLGSTHAGRALRLQGMFVTDWSATYYFDQINLLQLLCPAALLVLPLAWWRRLAVDESGVFLIIAAASMIAFQMLWKAQIGVYNDWNLYAIGGFVLSTLIWRGAAAAATCPSRRFLAAALAAVTAMHSYAWIAANHVHGR